MLSNQSKYAIRGVIFLALHASIDNKLGSKDVGKKINIPIPFLAKIFQHLSKEKIISSSKGPRGGFFLSKDQLKGNLMSIISSLEGEDHFNSCYMGLPKCSDTKPCAIHHLASPFNQHVKDEFKKRSIEDFALDAKKGKSHIF
jgi:Rrf2 family iron-sulfur cluster assembly transcriptional regulator